MTCLACREEHRAVVNAGLARGEPVRDIAGRAGIGKSSVERHKEHWLADAQAQAALPDHAAEVLADIAEVRTYVRGLMGKAFTKEDYRLGCTAVDRYLRAIELRAKVTGGIGPQVSVTTNVSVQQTTVLVDGLLAVLDPYPEARLAAAAWAAGLAAGEPMT